MTDVSTLKTEIKTWERSFRAKHGREPSVQDIKSQPDLAEKYRQYKKLTKGAEPAKPKKTSTPPLTPPKAQSRPSAHPSLLLSKPRSIAAAQPLSGYNPFSPQKNKGKQKELSPDPYSRPIPFRITSPVPFPPTSSTSAEADDPFAPTPDNPISRARKRLRGEPVSPSPNKEKRRRMVSPHEESDDEPNAGDTSFVDDSPVKLPNGVRSFKLLFDESSAKPKFPSLSRTKTLPAGLFGESVSRSQSMDIDEVASRSVKTLAPNKASVGQQDDPFADSAEGTELDVEMADNQKPDATARILLAPSPPPETRRPSGHPHNAKGKGKPANKADPLSDEEDGSDEDFPMNGNESRHRVRLFDRTASRGRVRDEDDVEENTLQFMTRRPPDIDADVQPETSESISLPDTLLSILSLAPTSSHSPQDEHVVQQLLYGARRGNYDASKGGEIWSVGEFEKEERDEFALDNGSSRATRGVYDEEDDWEGEGVPWEVGEL
ncbi:hypothetical protein K438DRAFT_1954628 [Mycena galopus ATCC 62051]|nr:hypothetical protein K438DRAFT_1954628 [Mycena galopus ATCC 62051]